MPASKFFSYLTWFILIVLSIPSTLIVLSWNALPGDPLYSIKRELEGVVLAVVSPSYELSVKLNVKYSDRRFSEAKALLSEKHSIVGLTYFEQQLQTTQNQILQTQDTAAKEQLKTQMVTTLLTYQTQLETTKTQLAQREPTTPTTTIVATTVTPYQVTAMPTYATSTLSPTPIFRQTPPQEQMAQQLSSTQTVSPTMPVGEPAYQGAVQPVSTAQMVTAITQTQTQIDQAIKELEKEEKKEEKKEEEKKGKKDKDNSLEKHD